MNEKNSTQDTSGNREVILEMTQEKYDEMQSRGIDEEAIPSVGKHIFRPRSRKINPRDAKIKLTFYIEGDILNHFRKRAGENTELFEKLLNKALRTAFENDICENEIILENVAEKLVNNSKFIEAVSEKLKAA